MYKICKKKTKKTTHFVNKLNKKDIHRVGGSGGGIGGKKKKKKSTCIKEDK